LPKKQPDRARGRVTGKAIYNVGWEGSPDGDFRRYLNIRRYFSVNTYHSRLLYSYSALSSTSRSYVFVP